MLRTNSKCALSNIHIKIFPPEFINIYVNIHAVSDRRHMVAPFKQLWAWGHTAQKQRLLSERSDVKNGNKITHLLCYITKK